MSSLIPASSLSSADLRSLGNNVLAKVRADHDSVGAINRSLQAVDEHVERLYRRSGTSRTRRLHTRSAA